MKSSPVSAPITAFRLRELIEYFPDTGTFVWKKRPGNDRYSRTVNTRRAGKEIASSPNKGGYLRVNLDGKFYYLHRIAYLYMTGQHAVDLVDHRDLDKSNNKWSNLRAATAVTNGYNARLRDRNQSRFKGVYLCRPTGRYYAQIRANKETVHLGHFATAEEASAARIKAMNRLHGEFARAA